MFVIVPFIDSVASWLDQRIQTTEFNAETGADQGHRAGQHRRRGVLADPRPRARRAGDHRLPPGHQPGGADLAARDGRLLAAVDAAVRPQAGRRSNCARRSGARPPTGASPCISVEIRDIGVPPALQDAMSRQAQAERESLARVLLGQAEQEVAQKFVEAAEIYARSPAALQLRAMNIIYETTKERGATILMPTAMVDGMNPAACSAWSQARRKRGREVVSDRRLGDLPLLSSRRRYPAWRRRETMKAEVGMSSQRVSGTAVQPTLPSWARRFSSWSPHLRWRGSFHGRSRVGNSGRRSLVWS